MRVMVVLNSLFTGGAEYSTLELYGWLARQGSQIRLVCCGNSRLAFNPSKFGLQGAMLLTGKNFLSRRAELKKLIHEFRPNAVHSVLFNANMLCRSVRVFNNSFVHIESLVNEMYSEFRYSDPNVGRYKLGAYRWVDRLTQKFGVDHFHANGRSVADHYKLKLGINERKITIVPRGRVSNKFSGKADIILRIRREFGAENRILFINVARHEYQKGQEVLIAAVADLEPEVRRRLKILLVGRHGTTTNLIQTLVDNYHLHETISIVGHRDDVQELLAASDVFVFPSRFEGLPGAIIEAEAASLPILCSDIPNNREVVDGGNNALFFRVDDVSGLCAQITRLTMDESLRARLGEVSLKVFAERYHIEQIQEQFRKFLSSRVGLKESNEAR